MGVRSFDSPKEVIIIKRRKLMTVKTKAAYEKLKYNIK